MPGSILIAILSGVASHLVLLTLLVFVVVGVQLFGSEQDSAAVSPVDATAATERVVTQEPISRKPIAGSEAEFAVSPRPATMPPAREPKPPKLIGGSLPVYPRPTEADASGNGFRPPESLTPLTVTGPVAYEARIQEARRAYWNGEFEVAEEVYLGIVTDYPDDADAFGELGNLYETMGERALARDAYFAAGERLKQGREFDKLSHIIDWLEKKGDERAEQLRRR